MELLIGASVLQLLPLMTQLTENTSEGARLLQLFLLMTKLTRKASGAAGGGQGVTGVPTDGATHGEGQ